ncbi:transposase IS116/IS110/IS902 [Rhodoferax ferrireducens T118]|uniref:Transposase IS116/IS110/IS902 n=1 Tax=Albidiferax ferrireducens (strain ATCC BAA-621 / DSM 15236 / T118) TaxID=338969 RepID=Q21Z96_ALBFT|nr:IS110 family transposase [Rhodoferax ferrireducens]ABD68907.1 transposase IS116/IS110/IS902 [Rhodoferax ferrireducens T118]
MSTPLQTVVQVQDAAIQVELYMSIELSDKKWQLTLSDGRRGPSRYSVEAGDTGAVAQCIAKAKERCKLQPQAKVHSCYEAGRDGWWLHRWLVEQGIDNIVIDSASIEVNRHARRAKTDRLDGDKLLTMLLRHRTGERVWSVLHEPSAEDEDARRTHRELARLAKERTAHTNRISSLLVLHNVRPRIIIGGRDWGRWWDNHCEQVPPALRAEIERESARLALVKQQVKALEVARLQELADGKQPLVAQLIRLRAIGPKGAWILVKELFGWRRFSNRRELAGCLGLAPTPYASGDSQIEQGISKAGNKRARALLVELSWSWLRLQPASDLSQWFNKRFAAGGKRMRRVGIVALARRLVIALWRYLEHGEIPNGAVLKPTTA